MWPGSSFWWLGLPGGLRRNGTQVSAFKNGVALGFFVNFLKDARSFGLVPHGVGGVAGELECPREQIVTPSQCGLRAQLLAGPECGLEFNASCGISPGTQESLGEVQGSLGGKVFQAEAVGLLRCTSQRAEGRLRTPFLDGHPGQVDFGK